MVTRAFRLPKAKPQVSCGFVLLCFVLRLVGRQKACGGRERGIAAVAARIA